jgi:hypothetical protein
MFFHRPEKQPEAQYENILYEAIATQANLIYIVGKEINKQLSGLLK